MSVFSEVWGQLAVGIWVIIRCTVGNKQLKQSEEDSSIVLTEDVGIWIWFIDLESGFSVRAQVGWSYKRLHPSFLARQWGPSRRSWKGQQTTRMINTIADIYMYTCVYTWSMTVCIHTYGNSGETFPHCRSLINHVGCGYAVRRAVVSK